MVENTFLRKLKIELHELTEMWSERRWWLNYTNLLKCGVNAGGVEYIYLLSVF